MWCWAGCNCWASRQFGQMGKKGREGREQRGSGDLGGQPALFFPSSRRCATSERFATAGGSRSLKSAMGEKSPVSLRNEFSPHPQPTPPSFFYQLPTQQQCPVPFPLSPLVSSMVSRPGSSSSTPEPTRYVPPHLDVLAPFPRFPLAPCLPITCLLSPSLL